MNDGEAGAPEAPKVDFFGAEQPVPEASAITDPNEEGEGGEGEGEGEEPKIPEAKADWKPGDPIEVNPVVVGLQKELASVKREYGGNLSGQREKIEGLETAIKELKEGKGGGDGGAAAEPLFKDIKRVKDLTADEQEAMTETEKRLMDENADFKETMNKMHADAQAGKADAAKRTTTQFNEVSKATALKLAGGNKEMANQIIEKFNTFADNDKLTDAQIEARMQEATKLVPSYKPPAERKPGGKGKPAGGAGQGEDPFGVQKFVDEATKNKGADAYPL